MGTMPRTVNRTPRHLDDPLKLGPFTPAQWAVAVLAIVLVWVVFTRVDFVPPMARVVAGATVVGLALGFTGGGAGGSLVELPRRAWHALITPTEHLPGPPRRGPLRFELYDDHPHEEDPPDA